MFPPSLDSSSPSPSSSFERVCVRFQRQQTACGGSYSAISDDCPKCFESTPSLHRPKGFSHGRPLFRVASTNRGAFECAHVSQESDASERGKEAQQGLQQTTLLRSRVKCLVFVSIPTDTRPEPEIKRTRKGSERVKERERRVGNSCGRLLRAANRLVHSKKKARAPPN